jgi:excisionase family DNA binding protein
MEPPAVERLAYSVRESTWASGLGRTTICEAMARGDLEFIKVGTRTLIPVEALKAFLASRSRRGAQAASAETASEHGPQAAACDVAAGPVLRGAEAHTVPTRRKPRKIVGNRIAPAV